MSIRLIDLEELCDAQDDFLMEMFSSLKDVLPSDAAKQLHEAAALYQKRWANVYAVVDKNADGK